MYLRLRRSNPLSQKLTQKKIFRVIKTYKNMPKCINTSTILFKFNFSSPKIWPTKILILYQVRNKNNLSASVGFLKNYGDLKSRADAVLAKPGKLQVQVSCDDVLKNSCFLFFKFLFKTIKISSISSTPNKKLFSQVPFEIRRRREALKRVILEEALLKRKDEVQK